MEALYDHATDRVAACIAEVVRLIVAELGPVLSGETPKPPEVDETAEDISFMAEERKIKLTQAVDVLQKVVGADDWDNLVAEMQKLITFATEATTTFLLTYDDIKHPSSVDLSCYGSQ